MILRTSIAILIFCEAGMLSMLGYAYVVPLLAIAGALYLFWRPIELDVPLAVKILVPMLLVGYFVARYLTIPELVNRGEWVFPTRVTVPLAECFLLGQFFELIKRRDPEDGLLNFCLLAMAVVVCCCCRTAYGTEGTLLFMGSVVCITLICTIFQYSTRTFVAADAGRAPAYTYRFSLISITIAMIGASSWYLSGSLRDNIEVFQTWWIRNIEVSGLRLTETSIGYTQDATLKNITELKNSNPMVPALRIYSDYPPGYLRGRAFDEFTGFRWRRENSNNELVQPVEPPADIVPDGREVFRLTEVDRGRLREIAVSNQSTASFFFLPLNAAYVAGQAINRPSRIQIDAESVVIRGMSSNVTYSGYVNEFPPTVELTPADRKRLTELPARLETGIAELARSITRQDRTDRERIASIEEYFNDDYRYSIEQKSFPRNRDHLSYFIKEKPPAHCEFFASAAVVFLRANSIPARYVTGFATSEKSTEADYYIARNKDAHAWAEAYDRDRKQWVVVEATPGTVLPRSIWDDEDDESRQSNDRDGSAGDLDTRSSWSNFFYDIWIQLRVFFSEFGRQLRGPLNIALVTLLIVTIFYQYWWKKYRNPYWKTRLGLLEKERIKVEKVLARYRLSRQQNETMHQFERRLRAECDPETLSRIQPIIDWFRLYESVRFGARSEAETIPIAPNC